MKKIILTDTEKDYIYKSLLYDKKSLELIAKELHHGVESISREAKIIMGPNFNFRKKSYINSNYFEDINQPEKAYWLGFLAADGYIYQDQISLQLQAQDKQHLEKFNQAVNGNFHIQEIHGINNFGKDFFHYRITSRDKKMSEDLQKWGVHPAKSLNLEKPNIKEEFIPYWILGYLDGDGSIQKNRAKYRMVFTGTLDILTFIKDFLHSNNKIVLAHRCINTYSIAIENDLSISFLRQYNYINLSFCLERKKEIVKIYNQQLPNSEMSIG